MVFWKNFKRLLSSLPRASLEELICKYDFQLPGRKQGIGGGNEG
jgi:hypothetical protein